VLQLQKQWQQRNSLKKTFEVANIKCSGCANTVTKELNKTGFSEVEVDLSCEPRKVTVMLDDMATEALLQSTLRKLGYPFFDEEVNAIDGVSLKAKSFISCAIGKFTLDNN
jgi:copper chaperone CopZ